jgi:hypothetical protein
MRRRYDAVQALRGPVLMREHDPRLARAGFVRCVRHLFVPVDTNRMRLRPSASRSAMIVWPQEAEDHLDADPLEILRHLIRRARAALVAIGRLGSATVLGDPRPCQKVSLL